jgi:hypothetical protein
MDEVSRLTSASGKALQDEPGAVMGSPPWDALLTLARRFTGEQTAQPIRSASSMMIPSGPRT